MPFRLIKRNSAYQTPYIWPDFCSTKRDLTSLRFFTNLFKVAIFRSNFWLETLPLPKIIKTLSTYAFYCFYSFDGSCASRSTNRAYPLNASGLTTVELILTCFPLMICFMATSTFLPVNRGWYLVDFQYESRYMSG